jgi:hypothetical protein
MEVQIRIQYDNAEELLPNGDLVFKKLEQPFFSLSVDGEAIFGGSMSIGLAVEVCHKLHRKGATFIGENPLGSDYVVIIL